MLMDKSARDFITEILNNSAAPGGGSVAAYSGAMAAALACMVAGLTLGKKKHADVQEEMAALQAEAKALAEYLLVLVDRDSQVYLDVMRAFKLPKDSDEQKQIRKNAIRLATIDATRIPLETMGYAVEAMKLLAIGREKGNPNCASDISVGILCARSALEGAFHNVAINLEALGADPQAAEFKVKADKLREAGNNLADSLLQA